MGRTTLIIIVYGLAAAGANLLGGLLVSSRKLGQATLRYLIALGAGLAAGAATFMRPDWLLFTPFAVLLGDTIIEAEVPLPKILFYNDLLRQHPLRGEAEFLVIGGDYRVHMSYWRKPT